MTTIDMVLWRLARAIFLRMARKGHADIHEEIHSTLSDGRTHTITITYGPPRQEMSLRFD